jgi:endonuclease IV
MQRPHRWGCHVSSDGQDIDQLALALKAKGMSCFQIFFGGAKTDDRRKLTKEETEDLRTVLQREDISFNTHYPYHLNLCRDEVSLSGLQTEINRVGAVGGRVVVHTGSCVHGSHANRDLRTVVEQQYSSDEVHKKSAKFIQWERDWKQGADTLIKHVGTLEFPASLNKEAIQGEQQEVPIVLLLEPPAGEGKKLGWHLKQIEYIFARMPPQVGFCLDTCHAFAAGACRFSTGEEVETFFADLGKALGGIHKLKLIHLNDSEDGFGSMKDLHASLTQGHIWNDEKNLDGLVSLWLLAQKLGIDIVSEVGAQADIDVMRQLSQ